MGAKGWSWLFQTDQGWIGMDVKELRSASFEKTPAVPFSNRMRPSSSSCYAGQWLEQLCSGR